MVGEGARPHKLIIGVSGKKGSGKTTFVNQVRLAWAKQRSGDSRFSVASDGSLLWAGQPVSTALPRGVRVVSMADPLKEFCVGVLGLSILECCGTDEDKNKPTHIRWPAEDSDLHGESLGWPYRGKPMTGREVMQYFGTDLTRAWVPDIWANACATTASQCREPVVLVPDCRFPNEVDVLRKLNCADIMVRLVRLKRAPHPDDKHESETALDSYPDSTWNLVVPDCDGVEAQGNFIQPFVATWLDSIGKDSE